MTRLSPASQGLRRNQLCRHIDLGLPASRTVRKYMLLFKPLHQWYFVTAAQADQAHLTLLFFRDRGKREGREREEEKQ